MQDLKYLTIEDLERLSANLKQEIISVRIKAGGDFNSQLLKEDEELLAAVDAEILERTLLQYDTDGGVSN